MNIGAIILAVLLLFFIGALPFWPHSRRWKYYPSGGVAIVFVIMLILMLMGRI